MKHSVWENSVWGQVNCEWERSKSPNPEVEYSRQMLTGKAKKHTQNLTFVHKFREKRSVWEEKTWKFHFQFAFFSLCFIQQSLVLEGNRRRCLSSSSSYDRCVIKNVSPVLFVRRRFVRLFLLCVFFLSEKEKEWKLGRENGKRGKARKLANSSPAGEMIAQIWTNGRPLISAFSVSESERDMSEG